MTVPSSGARSPRAVLVSMPWAPVPEPSLGLAILSAQLKADGIPCRVLHANTRLLQYVTYETYTAVSGYWGINEFVFTELLSPGVDEKQLEALIDRSMRQSEGSAVSEKYPTPELMLDMLLRFRGQVSLDYLSDVASEVLADQPSFVGLTCMFDQTMASVALAKLIKQAAPETMVVLGGYALEGPPGQQVVSAFPWIDGVCNGDGEHVITRIARASVGEEALGSIPGLVTRESFCPATKADLRASPHPDYSSWFEDLGAISDGPITIKTGALPVESSRGCWWGQRKHCVFCGIDEETLKFRFKPAQQTLDMLHHMRSRYGDHAMRFSDYILPRQYFTELLPPLAEVEPRFRLHCELKANQSAEAMHSLAQAGFEEVQPGIESFSSEVLKLMDKGVSGMQNVYFLKLGFLERIVVHYNFIYGFPGEEPQWYEEMLEQIPLLYHFTPPVARTEAIITRFAPLHADPPRFGITRRPRHHRCYDTLFSQDFLREAAFNLDDYAYYFDRHFDPAEELCELYSQVVLQINHWKAQHRTRDVTLEYLDDGQCLEIADSRFGPELVRHRVDGLSRRAYLMCDAAPVSSGKVLDDLVTTTGCSADDAAQAFQTLASLRLLWREGTKVLGLAVPAPLAQERIQSQWKHRWAAVYR